MNTTSSYKYNILFIFQNPFNPSIGGTERVTDLLAKALQERGHNIFYLSGKVKNTSILNYNFPVPQYLFKYDGLFNRPENITYYKELIKLHHIDIIINQSGYHPSLNKCLDVNVKKISVIHYDPQSLLKFDIDILDKANKDKISRFKFILKQICYPYLKYLVKKRTYKFIQTHYNTLMSKSDAIVLLSNKYIKDFYYFNIKPNNHTLIEGIPNPITFEKQNINFNHKEKIVLYVGRLSIPDKNPIRLLQIWNLLYKKNPNWKLILVGDGPSEKEIKDYVLTNKIQRVFFEGRQQDVLSYYRKASFICLTSNTEGWGMTLIEGMSCGCIPFSFNNYSAASDIINNGINGYLIKPYNLKKYASTLNHLMNNSQKRKDMSIAAQYKSSTFNKKHITDKWEELFDNITQIKNQKNSDS